MFVMHMHMFCKELSQPTMCLGFLRGFCSAQAACHEASDVFSAGMNIDTLLPDCFKQGAEVVSLIHRIHCTQAGVIVRSEHCKPNDKADLACVVERV